MRNENYAHITPHFTRTRKQASAATPCSGIGCFRPCRIDTTLPREFRENGPAPASSQADTQAGMQSCIHTTYNVTMHTEYRLCSWFKYYSLGCAQAHVLSNIILPECLHISCGAAHVLLILLYYSSPLFG